MGITYETAPVIDDGFDFNPSKSQECGPEDRADRTPHLLVQVDVSEVEQEDVDQQKVFVGPQEQILALYDEYRPRLFRYLRSMRLDRDQAEEVIQETFMRLTTELLQENDIQNVQGWIVRVAHNFAVDVLRANDRDTAGTPESILAIENRVDPAQGPEETYLKKEQIRRMEVALSTFNLQQRHCFHMRVQGFRYKDIGLALGISEQRAAFVLKQVAVRLAATCG